MGVVYLGADGYQLSAVKVIRPDLASDPTFRARFRREIAAASRVRSRYVAGVLEADSDAEFPWMASEVVDGPSLDRVIHETGKLETPALIGLATALSEGLEAIHSVGIVHRDLKPSNILLASDGPRIVDFGIAYAASMTAITTTGVVVGSPGYMSPEQARGQQIGPSSDVFSLASVLVFAASGQSPFGEGATADVLYRVVHEEARLPALPDELRPLVLAALTKDVAARPTAASFHASLAGTTDPDATLAAFVSATMAMGVPTVGLVAVSDRTTRRRGRTRARADVAFVGAALGIVAVAVAVVALALHSNSKTATGVDAARTHPSKTTAAPATSLPPPSSTTTTTSTTLPTTEPVTAASVAAPPTTAVIPSSTGTASEMPSAIAGYVKYGALHRDTVRVFAGSQQLAAPPTFTGQMNSCGAAMWTARWSSYNPDVSVYGLFGSAVGPPGSANYDPKLNGQLPRAATAGYLAGFICSSPSFLFGEATNGNQSNLTDITVEWQYWDRSVK
jgi:hypothetical protein